MDRRTLIGFGLSALANGTPLRAAIGDAPSKLPIGLFAAKPAMQDLALSPDGLALLARIQVHGAEMLGTYTLATGELKAFALPEDSDLVWFRWAGNDRFVVSLAAKAVQIESYGGSLGRVTIEGRRTRLICFNVATQTGFPVGPNKESLQGDDVLFIDPEGEYLILSVAYSIFGWPEVRRCSLKDKVSSLIQNPMDGVHSWFADDKGIVRAGIGTTNYEDWFLAYRSAPDAPMRRMAKGPRTLFERNPFKAMRIVAGSDEGYVLSSQDSDFICARKFDFAKQALGDRVFACPTNDATDLDFNEIDHALEAVRYTDDRPRVAWLDPLLREIQEGIDRAMPGRQNQITSRSADKTMLVVHSGTTRDPGTFYIFNLANTKMSPVVRPDPSLDPARLAPMEAVTYRARDGLTIPAFLTLPVGRETKHLPLVIMPHGGPYGVRDALRFDPLVQLLANRGFVVLQPNYRGSDSYGETFHKKGEGEWGRRMQDDLDDGMDWLVGRGIVDPARACLVGSSYGGYAAAWGATRNPERYRCAACFAGVYDLRAQLSYTGDFLTSGAYQTFKTVMRGDDAFDLRTVSPLYQVDRLKVPLLLVHGDDDSTVPVSQSRNYAAALDRAGKPHEFHIIKGEGHGFRKKDSFAFYLGKLDTFLETHNPGAGAA